MRENQRANTVRLTSFSGLEYNHYINIAYRFHFFKGFMIVYGNNDTRQVNIKLCFSAFVCLSMTLSLYCTATKELRLPPGDICVLIPSYFVSGVSV